MDDPTQVSQSFGDADALNLWMADNHALSKELWVRIYKKGLGITSLDWNDCVRVSLTWGWIDGLKRSADEASYFQRLTPRRSGSAWSQRNRTIAENLIESGIMQPQGLEQVEIAKANGQWDAAYAGSATMTFPDDFLNKLGADASASQKFKSLRRSELFEIYSALTSARTEKTRSRRMANILMKLSQN